MTLLSYGARLKDVRQPSTQTPANGMAYPATSFTMSLTNAVLLLSFPLEREMRGLTTRASVTY